MTSYLDKYRVDDLILDLSRVRLVFLLESPYTDEISHGHPLAGRSGSNMARFLAERTRAFSGWDRKKPIGCQILARNVREVGLMNCSNYPLDKTVYCQADYENHREEIEGRDLVRRNPGCIRRNNSRHTDVETEIVYDLARRLRSLPDNILVIPCGNVARSLSGKCTGIGRIIYSDKVPHPSRNNWSSDKFFDDLKGFLREIDCRLSV